MRALANNRHPVPVLNGAGVVNRLDFPGKRGPRPAFRRVGSIVFSAHLFLGLFALVMSPLVDSNGWWWLAPFCGASLLMIAYLVYRALRTQPTGLLFEIGLFLAISCGVYYAFGPLLFVIGPSEAAQYSRSWYRVDATESVWLTGLNFVGFGVAGIAYLYARFPWLAKTSDTAAFHWGRVPPARVFIGFLLLGLAAKYLFVLPYELRLSEDIPAGVIRQMSRLLAIALLVGWAHKDAGPWWMNPITKLLLASELVTGFLMFNKTEVLIAIMASALGHYFAGGRFRTLLLAAMVGFLVYVTINPLVTFGRDELAHRGGGVPAPADLMERFDIANSYATGTESHFRRTDISGTWWSRFNYLPPQQAAVQLYRQGRGSDDFERLGWIIVPRLLFPDKPMMTGAGVDLTEKVTGLRNSSTGVGVFVDGYYMLGWLGVMLASVTYGLALRAYSVVARSIVNNRAVALYPLVFMGIYVGLRADGMWLTDVAGPLVFMLALLGLFRLSSKLGRGSV